MDGSREGVLEKIDCTGTGAEILNSEFSSVLFLIVVGSSLSSQFRRKALEGGMVALSEGIDTEL